MSGPTRRQLLVGLGATAAACGGDREPRDGRPGDTGAEGPAPERPPEPADWEAPGDPDDAAFAWGVAAGDPLPDGVLAWTRTTEPEVVLIVMGDAGGTWAEVARRSGLAVRDEVVTVEVDGLAPDTAHAYVFTTPDGTRRSRVGRFRTALGEGAWRQVTFGATSCLGGSDPAFPSLAHAASDRFDLFLLLGDTVYADGARTVDDYRAEWRAVERVAAYQDVVASAAIVAIWDDHEIENNWTLGEPSPTQTRIEPEQLEAGRQAWQEAVPMRPGPGGSGIWRRLGMGPVLDVFVLDCRGERSPTEMISEEQLQWLLDGLTASEAVFKIVLVSIHFTNHEAVMGPVEAMDRWQGYEAQRDRLVATAETVPGVLFVTGDMHYGGIQLAAPAGAPGEHLVEVAAGPSGSDLFPLDTILGLASDVARAQYLDVVEDWNYARFVADPGSRTLRVELVDDAGAVRAARTVTFPTSGPATVA